MPSPHVEEIPINDTLKELGATKFQKIDTAIFQIFLGENRLIMVDIVKEASKTLKNLKDAAQESGLDKDEVSNLKTIVARDYPLLKLVEIKEQTEGKSNDKQKEQSSSAVKAVHLAREFCEDLFLDNLGQPYAAIKVDEHIEVIPIKSEKFKNWLTNLYFDVTVAETQRVHAAVMLHGESGAAKTAKQEMVKMIVDPSQVLTLSISYDIESMAQKIAHNYVCFFDNISKISDTIQDLLCRAITGTGFMKRELFTVDEEVIYKVRHALGLTGVNLAATKSDLIDRGLIIEHKPITNKKRLVVIWDKFEALRPKLLGHIFDILVKVLKYEKEHPQGLELEDYPRLADFAEVGEIISRCMGYKEMQFMNAFNDNIASRHRKIINDSSVGQAIEIFVTKKTKIGRWENGEWKGTMTELLPLLREIAICAVISP